MLCLNKHAENTDAEKAGSINIACQKPLGFGYATEYGFMQN